MALKSFPGAPISLPMWLHKDHRTEFPAEGILPERLPAVPASPLLLRILHAFGLGSVNLHRPSVLSQVLGFRSPIILLHLAQRLPDMLGKEQSGEGGQLIRKHSWIITRFLPRGPQHEP